MTQEMPPADVQPEPMQAEEPATAHEDSTEGAPRGAFLFSIGLITFYALYFALTYWEIVILRGGA